jgi:hypothetical protein
MQMVQMFLRTATGRVEERREKRGRPPDFHAHTHDLEGPIGQANEGLLSGSSDTNLLLITRST